MQKVRSIALVTLLSLSSTSMVYACKNRGLIDLDNYVPTKETTSQCSTPGLINTDYAFHEDVQSQLCDKKAEVVIDIQPAKHHDNICEAKPMGYLNQVASFVQWYLPSVVTAKETIKGMLTSVLASKCSDELDEDIVTPILEPKYSDELAKSHCKLHVTQPEYFNVKYISGLVGDVINYGYWKKEGTKQVQNFIDQCKSKTLKYAREQAITGWGYGCTAGQMSERKETYCHLKTNLSLLEERFNSNQRASYFSGWF